MENETRGASRLTHPRLRGRGLDDLIYEYETTADSGRRDRLERFFELCGPDDAPASPWDRHVRIGLREDLVIQGRIRNLAPSSRTTIDVLGKKVPDADVELLTLGPSTVFSDQTVLIDDLYVTHDIRHMNANWFIYGEEIRLSHLRNLDRRDLRARLWLPDACVSLPDNAVYFLLHAREGCLSFGHLIFDTLVQLVALDYLKSTLPDKVIPVVANDQPWLFRWPGMDWLVTKLIGPVSDIVHLQAPSRVVAQRVYSTNRLVNLDYGGVALAAVAHLRRRVFETIRPTPGSASPRRIYVSRKDAGDREAANIRAAEEMLHEFGFSTIVVNDLTPQEAFDAFNRAEIIAGMHGSGLMYHIYTEAPATIIELSYPAYEWEVIPAFATACGHRAIRIDCSGYNLDLDVLHSALTGMSRDARPL